MAERILGLDIGDSSVKAVLLSRGFRGGYRVLAVRLIDVADGGLPEALERLFADPALRGAPCVTALPAGRLSFRNVRLPFRDDKKIRQTLPFTLEPLLQTPVDELFVDHVALIQGGAAEVFAALAPRTLVAERTALLAPYVREIAVIDVDAVPLACRLMQKPGFPESALVLDIGARDTTAIFVQSARVVQIRHIPCSGEPPTGAPEPQAADGPPARAGSDLGNALRNTQLSLLWQGVLDRTPERVYLTGGGSRTAGLAERVSGTLGVPAERVDLVGDGGIDLGEAVRESWDPALLDQALALAARPMAKGCGFNFRQRAFEARADYGKLRERLRAGALLAGLILTLAVVEIGLSDYASRLRLAALKKQIATEFRRIDPETTRIVDPLTQLRGKIGELRKISAGTGDAARATVLDLLKEISELAPADLLLTAFALDEETVALKGEAKGFDSLEAFKAALARSRSFKAVTVGSTNQKREGTGVEFDLKVTLTK